MIPLIILDLDGTIIGSSGHVDDCVWKAVEKARGAGVRFAVCTGRPCFGVAQKVAKRLGPTTPHIFQNGAQIAYASGENVKVFALKEAAARSLVNQSRRSNLTLELYSPTTLFIERKTPVSEAHAKMIGVNAIVRDLYDVVENEPVVRAQWLLKTGEEEEASLEDDTLQTSTATSPALEGTLFVSITHKEVSKGEATRLLAQTMRLDLEDIVGVGDSLGDIPMLDAVGYPVVMGNAPEQLKERYETVAGDVDKCGVVPVIEQALSQQKAD